MTKTAVVLFNLGGPDSLAAVKPFLFNLFSDPAIIRLPQPLRWLIAKLISGRRDKVAQHIYAQMGGRSPILPNTKAQAVALEAALGADYKCFIAMRYWHPMTSETVRQVKDYMPDRIIVLPLYPQFSTTTTASSLKAWHAEMKQVGLDHVPSKSLCCYPTLDGFVAAVAAKLKPVLDQAKAFGTPRVLLSAHGLPEKIVADGDPYQWQCEQTAAAIRQACGLTPENAVLCYQSRVGPMQWIKPATDEEIKRAGRDKVPLVVVPIAFVSEHSETLVEIDIEYRKLAQDNGVPFYGYVPTVGDNAGFIDGLVGMVRQMEASGQVCQSQSGGRICPQQYGGCAQN